MRRSQRVEDDLVGKARTTRTPSRHHAGAIAGRRPSRVLIVDDHPLVRQGLAQIMQKEPDLTVCGEAGTVEEAKLALTGDLPDIVLLDLSLPGANGFDLLKDIHAQHPDLPVLVLSMHDEQIYAERALRAGARGYVEKQTPGSTVIEALRAILKGELGVSPGILSRIAKAWAGSPRGGHSGMAGLSDRELGIFESLGRGQSTREVATALHLSVKTVETHIGNMKRKLQVRKYADLVRRATIWVENDCAE